MKLLRDILKNAWTPADRREPWRWCEEHIKSIPFSPMPGPFRSENSPWIREVMEAIVDPKIRLVSIIAAVQSSKTTKPRTDALLHNREPARTLLVARPNRRGRKGRKRIETPKAF